LTFEVQARVAPQQLLYDSLDSTNEEALRLNQAGEQGPIWIRAQHQTNGRGRRGRTWLGQAGNLFATGLYTLDCSPIAAANLSFVAALAVAEAIDPYVGAEAISLKWPNDVLIEGRKTSGILLESWPSASQLCVAIGIGINVITSPEGVDQPITCVRDHLEVGRPEPTAQAIFEALILSFTHWFRVWQQGQFSPVKEAWLKRAVGIDKSIEVRLAHETLSGQFLGLGENGALLLKPSETGPVREITAGDVFFG
jgi:BirA family biotin operon repressor/biotin-[acetyl-CoA-carboxylase] ligase